MMLPQQQVVQPVAMVQPQPQQPTIIHQQIQQPNKPSMAEVGTCTKCMDAIFGWMPFSLAKTLLFLIGTWNLLIGLVFSVITYFMVFFINFKVGNRLGYSVMGNVSYVRIFVLHLPRTLAFLLASSMSLTIAQGNKHVPRKASSLHLMIFGVAVTIIMIAVTDLLSEFVKDPESVWAIKSEWDVVFSRMCYIIFHPSWDSESEPTVIFGAALDQEGERVIYASGRIFIDYHNYKAVYIAQEITTCVVLFFTVFCAWSVYHKSRVECGKNAQSSSTTNLFSIVTPPAPQYGAIAAPVVQQPVLQQPVVHQPVVQQPVVQQPTHVMHPQVAPHQVVVSEKTTTSTFAANPTSHSIQQPQVYV